MTTLAEFIAQAEADREQEASERYWRFFGRVHRLINVLWWICVGLAVVGAFMGDEALRLVVLVLGVRLVVKGRI